MHSKKPTKTLTIPAAAQLRDEHLLLGLVASQPRTAADVLALARMFGRDAKTIRRWRAALFRDGLVVQRDGWLELDRSAFDRWRAQQLAELHAAGRPWRSATLPVVLLAVGPNARRRVLPAAQLRAAAIIVSEAMRARTGIAADAELAAAAGVSTPTLRAARRALKRRGIIAVQVERRGRARRILRVTVTKNAWRFSLAGEQVLERLALLHLRGARGGRERLSSPHSPEGRTPEQSSLRSQVGRAEQSRAEPRRDRGDAIADLIARCTVNANARRHEGSPLPKNLGDLLREGTLERLERIAARDPVAACVQVLAAVGSWNRAPRKRAAAAGLLVQRHRLGAWVHLLAAVADAVADGVRDVAAVTCWRWRALLGREPKLALTRPSAPIAALIAAARQRLTA